MPLLSIFTLYDWLAAGYFLLCWIGYSLSSHYLSKRYQGLHATMNLYRRDWMYQLVRRDQRMHDVNLIGVFERSCAFFASSSLLILAGLLSLLGYSPSLGKVLTLMHLHFAPDKFAAITLMISLVFIYTFFVFTWSMRQFGFAGIMIVSAPTPSTRTYNKRQRAEFSDHCASIADLAATHFNYGLRAYYFALALLGWYIHPLAFALFTTLVVLVLYRREFRSRALNALRRAHRDIDPNINELVIE